MSLPSAWVDRLFSKLIVTYGHRFLGLYAGVDIEAVKADWADELTHYQQSPDALRYALEHLPPDHPPTVLQFRDLCRRAPQYAPKALPAPPPDPTLAQELRRAFKPTSSVGDKEWAGKLQRRIDAKEIRPTKFQSDALAEVLEVAQ